MQPKTKVRFRKQQEKHHLSIDMRIGLMDLNVLPGEAKEKFCALI